jgi:hypothetical protein
MSASTPMSQSGFTREIIATSSILVCLFTYFNVYLVYYSKTETLYVRQYAYDLCMNFFLAINTTYIYRDT